MNSENINTLIVGSTVTALAGCFTNIHDPPLNDEQKCRLDCRKAFPNYSDKNKRLKCYDQCTFLKKMVIHMESNEDIPTLCSPK